MKDGLYQVDTGYFCAGFVMKADKVIWCAPILRKQIERWKKVARWICD